MILLMVGEGGFGMRSAPRKPEVNREPRALTAHELTASGGLYHTNDKIKNLVDDWNKIRNRQKPEHEDKARLDLTLAHINAELDGLSAKNSVFRFLKLSISRDELDKTGI